MNLQRLFLSLYIFLSFWGIATEIVVENPTGFSFYSSIHYDMVSGLENRKDIISIPGKSSNLVVYSKAWIENGLVSKLKLERRFGFSSSFWNLTLNNGLYISQEQQDHIIAPAELFEFPLINPFQFLKDNIKAREKRFVYTELDPVSGSVFKYEYSYQEEDKANTEIGKVNVIVYEVEIESMGFKGKYSFDYAGEPIIGNFMGSIIYNLKYFPSKWSFPKFDFESEEISPYLFGNNYWSESYIKQTFGFVKNSAIEIVRWGGIYRDKAERNQGDLNLFRDFVDYTEVAPLIQLGYFVDESVEKQLEKILRFIPETKYVSFSNEANIYPVIIGRKVSIEEFNSRYRAGILKIKEKVPALKIVGPDFSVEHLPQYDSWLKIFLEENGDLIDIFSIHYYPFDGSQSTERTLKNIDEFPIYIDQLKTLLGKYGLENIPIAITETNTSYDYSSSGPGNPSTFEAALWTAAAYITGIEKKLWSIQLWGLINDGTLSLMNTQDGLTNFKPSAHVYNIFKDFGSEYIPATIKFPKLKIAFSPNKDLGLIVAVAVNYDAHSKNIAFKKIGGGISVELQENGIEIKGLSITLFYLNERLEVVHKKYYTK